MSQVILRDGKKVADYSRPYIIAEVNSSHNGNIEVAKKMIDVAVDAGCDCVKFQSWSSSTLYSRSYYKENPIAKRFVDKFSMTSETLMEMARYCRMKKIGFSSTPYSKDEVDFLVEECNVPFIKVSSMEVNNPEFLGYIAKKGLPTIISTGMADISEVKRAINIFESLGNRNVILLHCVSLYPTPIPNINVNNILGLRECFPDYPIGFSDHTVGDTSAIVSIALGAAAIEKHITLDASKIGMDNQMAMEPDALKQYVIRCHEANSALGTKERILLDEEKVQRKNMRRSIVTTRELKCGHVLSREDMDVKRPGIGISPDKIDELVGKRLKKDIGFDILIMNSDLENMERNV